MNRFVLATVLAGVALVPMWVSGGHRPAHAATLTIHHRFTAHVDVRGIREQTSRTPMLPRSRVKQTASGAVTSGTQLRLPASAFPSDSVKVNDEEKVAATADDTFFGQIHSSSYERLGMEAGWFEYYSSPVSDGVMDVVYLGSYYASSSQAKAALNDFANAPSTPSGFPCALGDQCIQYGLTIRFSDGDYQGYLRFVQQSNALAEMVSVVPAADFGKLASQTATNLNHVSTAFMSAIPATTATVTATPTVTATAVNAPTKTPTPTSTPKPTITPTATTIPTDVPVAFTVLSARTEKAGSAPDTGLKRAPVARVRVGTRVYESLYVLVQSAPTGASADYSVRITNRGKQVLQRSMTEPVAAGSSSPFRVYVSFKPARAGTYKVRWQVAVSSVNKTAANSLAVHT